MSLSGFYNSISFILTFFLFGFAALNHSTSVDPQSYNWSVTPMLSDTVIQSLDGKQLYQKACAHCHGATGAGVDNQKIALTVPIPDFTDCDFANREPDADWMAIAHQGGPTRGFAKEMPAFGEALTTEQLQKIMDHIRSFCKDKSWPRGELNLPRPLITEKAYPEDEAVISSFIDVENEGSVMNEIVYEQRFGARNQLEIVVPFGFAEGPAGNWGGGQLGDIALGVKRALYHNINSGRIFSVTGEVIFPTGDRGSGFGKGTTIMEPFVSFGQILPGNAFFHFQGGAEIPVLRDKASDEAFWRGVLGYSLTQGQWGRTWSPMVELTGARELESGAENYWNVIPQMQVTLNQRQNIMMNIGVELPVDDPSRDTRVMVYILWDWFDGGLFDGW